MRKLTIEIDLIFRNDIETKKPQQMLRLLKWCHQESNQGHKDFQSFALPTELWHLPFKVAQI